LEKAPSLTAVVSQLSIQAHPLILFFFLFIFISFLPYQSTLDFSNNFVFMKKYWFRMKKLLAGKVEKCKKS
jgi:hypothetical protein